MGLVSSIYRMAPGAGFYDRDEAVRLCRVRLKRIVAVIGPDEASRKIRAWPPRDEDERARVTWLAMEADRVRPGQRAGTV